ncbi:MAG: hypothetical protein RJA22_1874 [Verrucomicrobiota bacterium]
MIRPSLLPSAVCPALLFLLALAFPATAQTLTVSGVTDRTQYRDRASFIVLTNAGFTYDVRLNGKPVPAGVTNTTLIMDYYDLVARRTQISDGAVTNVLIRFIVQSSNRLKAGSTTSPENGLLEWTPLPPIASTAAEMAGATLGIMTPQQYPAGLEIPVIARLEDAAGRVRRANGWVADPAFPGSEFRLLRGVGHGFLPPASPGTLSYTAQLPGLQTNKQIEIEPATTWTQVAGTLPDTTWPTNSRIHVTGNVTIPAGVTLAIGPGTVVRLNPGVNITNTGRTIIEGTPSQPVVFTATNRIAPERHTGAWGGFFMRGGSAELIASAAIFTGAGAASSISFSPGSSHRAEQPLFFAHNCAVRMTNCAMVSLAGQVGNGYFASIVWDRCLVQRAITVGEYEGGTNIVTDSALIEFPSVDGIYDANIVDADYDGFYAIRNTNYFANTLLGFAKDDAIDSGSGGPGTFVVTNCWVESATHEALAWSGEGRRTWTYDSVLLNCGQGLEAGWSTTNTTSLVSPIVLGERIFSSANCVGVRFGDNYTGTSGLGNKAGFLTLTNSLVLHNYRDVWGQVWDNTWNYRTNRMDVRSNLLTAVNTNHPLNTVWDPASHGAALAPFLGIPGEAPVGIGIALWPHQLLVSQLTNGIPVRLSSFTTNTVSVDYIVASPNGTLAQGTLTFEPGRTVRLITLSPPEVAGVPIAQLRLSNPVGGELTDLAATYLTAPLAPLPAPSVHLIPSNSVWRYSDTNGDLGTAWRTLNYTETNWNTGPAELGFGDGGEATLVNGGSSTARTPTFYFRHKFVVNDPAAFNSLYLGVQRDDGAVAYLNNQEVYRGNVPAGATYATYTTTTTTSETTYFATNLSPATLVTGTNIMAVEVHQSDAASSDMSFNLLFVGLGNPPPPSLLAAQFASDLVLYWGDSSFQLQTANSLAGPWQTVPGAVSPFSTVPNAPQRFYRLAKP